MFGYTSHGTISLKINMTFKPSKKFSKKIFFCTKLPILKAGRYTGFSLIELVSVLAILSILATVALPMSELVVKRNKEQELRYDLRQLRDAIDAYKRAVDEGHIARKIGETGYPVKLDDLVNGVEDLRDPKKAKIYFLRSIPTDPMAPPEITGSESWQKRSYASPPDDPHEGEDIYDVHSGSAEMGMDGIAYNKW
jgi:general secretion pathway protein G